MATFGQTVYCDRAFLRAHDHFRYQQMRLWRGKMLLYPKLKTISRCLFFSGNEQRKSTRTRKGKRERDRLFFTLWKTANAVASMLAIMSAPARRWNQFNARNSLPVIPAATTCPALLCIQFVYFQRKLMLIANSGGKLESPWYKENARKFQVAGAILRGIFQCASPRRKRIKASPLFRECVVKSFFQVDRHARKPNGSRMARMCREDFINNKSDDRFWCLTNEKLSVTFHHVYHVTGGRLSSRRRSISLWDKWHLHYIEWTISELF